MPQRVEIPGPRRAILIGGTVPMVPTFSRQAIVWAARQGLI
jgi:hypothetical protein